MGSFSFLDELTLKGTEPFLNESTFFLSFFFFYESVKVIQ